MAHLEFYRLVDVMHRGSKGLAGLSRIVMDMHSYAGPPINPMKVGFGRRNHTARLKAG